MSIVVRRRHGRALLALARDVPAHVDEAVRRLRPDLIVFDPFRLGWHIAFHRHGIPAVAFSSKPLLTGDPLVPPYTSAVVPDASPRGRLRVRLAWLRVRAAYLRHRLALAAERVLTGYSPMRLWRMLAAQSGFPAAPGVGHAPALLRPAAAQRPRAGALPARVRLSPRAPAPARRGVRGPLRVHGAQRGAVPLGPAPRRPLRRALLAGDHAVQLRPRRGGLPAPRAGRLRGRPPPHPGAGLRAASPSPGRWGRCPPTCACASGRRSSRCWPARRP